MEFLSAAFGNLLSPMILFFVLGLFAALVKSDLEIPPAIGKFLSLYLMIAIGFKGGVELARTGLSEQILLVGVAGMALSLLIPFLAFGLLKVMTRLDPVNAAAVSAHYGSVSVVTFVTATAFLSDTGLAYAGYFVAVMALMESPAIVSGLLLARGSMPRSDAEGKPRRMFSPAIFREVFVSGSILLLLGSLLIGWATGEKGLAAIGPFVVDPFRGLLAIFLLDMGLIVARRLGDFRAMGASLVAFGIVMPLVGGSIGIGVAWLLGLDVGGATLLAVLCASASYIAVPAAMRQALPQANPSIYVTLSLGITFPFNVMVGIPLFHALARLFIPV